MEAIVMIQNLKIRNRLLIFVLGTVLTILVTVSLVFFFYSKQILVSESQSKAIEKVNAVAGNLEGHLKEKSKIAWTLCRHPRVINWLKTNEKRRVDPETDPQYKELLQYMKVLAKSDEGVETIFLASEKNQFYYDSTNQILDDSYMVGKRGWYQNAVKKKRPVWDVDVDFSDKKTYVNYRHPIYDESGTLLGVGGMDISLKDFKKYISQLGDTFETAEASLVSHDGEILVHRNPDLELKKKLSDFKEDGEQYDGLGAMIKKIKNQEAGISRVIFNGQERYWVHTPIKSLEWTLILSVAVDEVTAPLSYLKTASILIIIIASIFLLGVILYITRSISNPITHLLNMLKDIAEGEGDLTKRLVAEGKDEIGEVALWFNQFIEQIQSIVQKVQTSAADMLHATKEITVSSENLSSRTNEQSDSIKETSTTMETFNQLLNENSRNAESADTTIGSFNQEVQSKRELISNVTSTMEAIDQSGNKIGEIVNVINDISFQTNLLALNAAVEAARAGEAGRGFAVVASEVRNLAQKTADSSKTISEIISHNIDSTQKGKTLVQETAHFFDSIIRTLSELVENIENISSGSQKQSSGVEKINSSISHLETVVTQNLLLVEEFTENGRKLNSNALELEKLVEQFKVH
jgi:methyl-accepting chemotaxis protein